MGERGAPSGRWLSDNVSASPVGGTRSPVGGTRLSGQQPEEEVA